MNRNLLTATVALPLLVCMGAGNIYTASQRISALEPVLVESIALCGMSCRGGGGPVFIELKSGVNDDEPEPFLETRSLVVVGDNRTVPVPDYGSAAMRRIELRGTADPNGSGSAHGEATCKVAWIVEKTYIKVKLHKMLMDGYLRMSVFGACRQRLRSCEWIEAEADVQKSSHDLYHVDG